MKKLVLLMTLVITALGINAQTTKVITGAVIDPNGNPIPNALVEATGGADCATTDADGSFRLEVPIWLKSVTAKYAGFKDKKVKIKNDSQIIFEMKPKGANAWFLDAAYSTNFGDGEVFHRVGLMGGYLGKWGGYAKLLFGCHGDYVAPVATMGVIKQVSKPVYLYLGLGFAPVVYEDSYYYDYVDYDWWPGAMFEVGTILRFNKVNVSVGYGIGTDFEDYNHSLQLSVGYCF